MAVALISSFQPQNTVPARDGVKVLDFGLAESSSEDTVRGSLQEPTVCGVVELAEPFGDKTRLMRGLVLWRFEHQDSSVQDDQDH